MLTVLILIVHVPVSLALILLILLHSGRGGGLSDMFGGAVGSAAAGSTVVERNLDRITVGTAVLFSFTTILLALRLQLPKGRQERVPVRGSLPPRNVLVRLRPGRVAPAAPAADRPRRGGLRGATST